MFTNWLGSNYVDPNPGTVASSWILLLPAFFVIEIGVLASYLDIGQQTGIHKSSFQCWSFIKQNRSQMCEQLADLLLTAVLLMELEAAPCHNVSTLWCWVGLGVPLLQFWLEVDLVIWTDSSSSVSASYSISLPASSPSWRFCMARLTCQIAHGGLYSSCRIQGWDDLSCHNSNRSSCVHVVQSLLHCYFHHLWVVYHAIVCHAFVHGSSFDYHSIVGKSCG